jgi:hypothetical protein
MVRVFQNRLSAAFVWAMVPFTIVSGIPRIGCICADGQHKLLCGKQLTAACCQDAETEAPSCPCCAKSESAQRLESVPAKSCCGQKAERPAGATVSKTCCTRYLVSPVVPTVAKIVLAPHPLPEWMVLEFVPAPGNSAAAIPVRDMLRSPDLPVSDLVILHQVFLI